MLRTGKVDKIFPPGIFISKKIVTNVKLSFTNVPVRKNAPVS